MAESKIGSKEWREKPTYKPHPDDRGYDEIRLVGEVNIRTRKVYRHKTSGLSGDEWRISTQWEVHEHGQWRIFDSAYGNIKAAVAAIYAGVYTDHADWHEALNHTIDFYFKGTKVYESSYDGESMPLLVALGHLPWALVASSEDGRLDQAWPDRKSHCFQGGCANPPISEYELIKEYCRWGHESEPLRPQRRRFCLRHLRRGDCGLEDADRNYRVIKGPGPDQAKIAHDDISESVFGGFVTLD